MVEREGMGTHIVAGNGGDIGRSCNLEVQAESVELAQLNARVWFCCEIFVNVLVYRWSGVCG